jgi:hypothetical protein
MSNKILIGVDPDVTASGYASLEINKFEVDCGIPNSWQTTRELKIHKLKFFEMFDSLNTLHKLIYTFRGQYTAKVYIEAGWLNTKSNWHGSGKGENVASRIGTKVGANHQVGKLIAEMCEYLGLEYELVQPKTAKMGAILFRKVTKYKGKLDQDMIDAALLIWGR